MSLLPPGASAGRRVGFEVAPERVYVDSATAHEPRIDSECLRRTALQDVDENALYTALVKCGVASVGNQIAQQSGALDARSPIPHHEVSAVRLAGHRTV